MITYLLDMLRIRIGDSECPLKKRCPGYDLSNDSCASNRGRDEVGGERAECYGFFKLKIKKQGILSRLSERSVKGIMHIGGLEE